MRRMDIRIPRTHLVPENFSFGVILKMPVSLEAAFNDLSELLSEMLLIE